MPRLKSLIGSHPFLMTSALAGAAGLFLPAVAHAEPAQPAPVGTASTVKAPAAANAGAGAVQTMVISAAAPAADDQRKAAPAQRFGLR